MYVAYTQQGDEARYEGARWLWSHGYRYRLNVKSVPGKPDIVMRPYRMAIFVNGCFWHGHNVAVPQVNSERLIVNSSCCKIPATNRGFWVKKIWRNQERDQENYRVLQENGWKVIVIWECQLKPSVIEHTMREVEVAEDTALPMAAEDKR